MKKKYIQNLLNRIIGNFNSRIQILWKKTWKNRRYFLWGILGILIFHLLALVVLIVAINKEVFGPIPNENQLKNIENPVAAVIFTADSVMMGKYYLQNRMDLENNDITPTITDALVATEDIRFYTHNGIDVKSLFRVLIKTILLRQRSSGGGSTITQQLAKNLYPRRDYPVASIVINKIKEMVIAVKLEKLYTKKQILMLYLNTVPFGEQTFGIKAGALRYFHKNPNQLKPEEVAVMVGMLKGTSTFNPRVNYKRALKRRNVVLLQMYRYGMINKSEKDSLSALPIVLDYYRFPVYAGVAPYYRMHIESLIKKILKNINDKKGTDYNLYTDGLKVYTTIDSRMQYFAETAMKEHLSKIQKILDRQWANADWVNNRKLADILKIRLDEIESTEKKSKTQIFDWKTGKKDTLMTPMEKAIYNAKLLQTGMMVMNNHNGEIKVWVGGIDQEFFEYDHVLSRRQVGSVFKPFVYLAALEDSICPCDFFNNRRFVYTDFDDWSPKNSTRKYEGMYSLKGALTHSVNTVSAKLVSEIGVSKVITIARKAGIKTNLPNVPSLALGTGEISLFELVQAYQTIANKGIKVVPKFITEIKNVHGDVIYKAPELEIENNQPISDTLNIDLLTAMLKNVVNKGTAARLRYKYNIQTDIAGKTGTTQNNADGWFVGFSPDLVAGVWVGADYPAIHFRDDSHGQGAATALPVWAGFFQKLYNDKNFKNLAKSMFSLADTVKFMLNCDDYLDPPDLYTIHSKEVNKVADIIITDN